MAKRKTAPVQSPGTDVQKPKPKTVYLLRPMGKTANRIVLLALEAKRIDQDYWPEYWSWPRNIVPKRVWAVRSLAFARKLVQDARARKPEAMIRAYRWNWEPTTKPTECTEKFLHPHRIPEKVQLVNRNACPPRVPQFAP